MAGFDSGNDADVVVAAAAGHAFKTLPNISIKILPIISSIEILPIVPIVHVWPWIFVVGVSATDVDVSSHRIHTRLEEKYH